MPGPLQEGCEFLVAESPDGQLDLQDSYVNTEVDGSSEGGVDYSSSAWRRPEGLDTVAQGQQRYLATPWYSYYPGDMIGGKEPKSWVSAGCCPGCLLLAVCAQAPLEHGCNTPCRSAGQHMRAPCLAQCAPLSGRAGQTTSMSWPSAGPPAGLAAPL